jgi:hypothetical protein
MSRYLPITDFRARRKVLVRSDFGLAEKRQPPPSDPIEEKVWRSIVTLPDDVAIRTSNHHGKALAQLDELSSAWIFSTRRPPYRERMSPVMLDANDEIQAAVYNCFTGYYRFSVSGMRNVLELIAIGCWAEVCGKKKEFRDWRKGKLQLGLGMACDGLIAGAVSLESHLKSTVNDTLFAQKNSVAKGIAMQGGYLRRNFSALSEFAHSRPNNNDSHFRESKGPIYVKSAFNRVAWIHFETIAIAYVLALIARPKMRISPAFRELIADTKRVRSRVVRAAFLHLS